MIAPDETTFAYLKGRRFSPQGRGVGRGRRRVEQAAHRSRRKFDRELVIDAATLFPTSAGAPVPAWSRPSPAPCPTPRPTANEQERKGLERALEYMGLKAGTPLEEVAIDRVFIGSCTNSRIEDLRAAARIAAGYKVSTHVSAMVVPGSQAVKAQAEAEGLDRIFIEAGFDWREPGCSMCLGMNPDILSPGERCASTSNRNFEGRQGRGGRTHLVSPRWPPPPPSPATSSTFATGRSIRTQGGKGLMEPFRTLTSLAAPLDRTNVDTDQIIPKQFLKRIERTGYGEFLFFDWRRTPSGDPDPEFELNDPRYKGAQILIAGKNFACGSSREHAAWALSDYGFRASSRRPLPTSSSRMPARTASSSSA
jgi:3-isopropylmalate dehydratase